MDNLNGKLYRLRNIAIEELQKNRLEEIRKINMGIISSKDVCIAVEKAFLKYYEKEREVFELVDSIEKFIIED